ncbi:MAG: hypothetical protein D6790_16645, partial [Caldilineae bacterium]
TYLACSNGITIVIRVPSRVKKVGIRFLRQRGKSKKNATLLLFAVCVFLLLEETLPEISQIVLDNEYDGQQANLKAFLLRLIWRSNEHFPPENLRIDSVGKKSPAHDAAWAAFRGQRRPDRTLTGADILRVLGR